MDCSSGKYFGIRNTIGSVALLAFAISVARPAIAGPAPVEGPTCKFVFDANDNLNTTPWHMYVTELQGVTKSEKPETTESIFVGGVRYIQFRGQWKRSPMTVSQMRDQELENRKNAKNQSCHFAKDDIVNGEAASVYSVHYESEDARSDGQVWISKRSGLILRNELDIDSGGGKLGLNHYSVRYDYSNVKAPL